MSASHEEQVKIVQRAVEGLPDGLVKTRMQAAINSLQQQLAGNAGSVSPTGAGTTLLDSLVHRLQAVTAVTLDVATPLHAVALAVHTAMLDAGLQCTGSREVDTSGATYGFAAVARNVPPSQLVPDGWVGEDGASFFFRYSSDRTGTDKRPINIALVLLAVGTHMIIHSQARVDGADKHGEAEVDVAQMTSPSAAASAGGAGGTSDAAIAAVRRMLAPLAEATRSAELRGMLSRSLLDPLWPPAQPARDAAPKPPQAASNGTAPAPTSSSGNTAPSRPLRDGGVMGIPVPLTGGRGHMDRDLFPDVSPAVPGLLIGGGGPRGYGAGGDSLVGPSHPLFGGVPAPGMHPPGFGGLPPGVPPGARFDPFGPPGTGIGPFPNRGGRGGGRGGGGIGFAPNPDHERVPHFDAGDDGDGGPPPGMYQ